MKIGESFSRQFSIHSSIIYSSINHCLLPHYLHTSKTCYAECFKLINLCLMAQHNRNFSCLFSFRLLNMLTCVYPLRAFRIFIFFHRSIFVKHYYCQNVCTFVLILHNFIRNKIGDLTSFSKCLLLHYITKVFYFISHLVYSIDIQPKNTNIEVR